MPYFGPYFGPSGILSSDTPLEVTIVRPYYRTRDLPPVAQGSEHSVVWEIDDVDGNPIDLSGKVLRLVAYTLEEGGGDQYTIYDDDAVDQFSYDSGQGIEVSGADSNIVTLTHNAAQTALAGDYRYMLWNVTDKIVLVKGRMPIEPAIAVEL